MKTTIIPDRTSCGNLEYLKNHLSEIQPIKKITCYQNSENFIFSEYAILTDGVFMAIESWKEKVLLCTGLNCGYHGTGPHATEAFLKLLKIPPSKIGLIFEYSGFTITFDETGQYRNMKAADGFFSQDAISEKSFGCYLDKTCAVNPVKRKVYMVDPQLHRPAAFFRCLEAMQPVEMEFTTQLGQSLSPLTYNEIFGTNGSNSPCNLLIRGKTFILYGFIRRYEILSTVQSVSLYCNRRALYDTIWWNENELCIESHVMKRLPIMIHLIKRLLVPRSPIHKTIPLGMGGGEE